MVYSCLWMSEKKSNFFLSGNKSTILLFSLANRPKYISGLESINIHHISMETKSIVLPWVGAQSRTDHRRKYSAMENNFNKTPMKTKTSKTIKACTFDNIQCLTHLKASGAKYSCNTQKQTDKTIIGFGLGPRFFFIIRYGSYTWILHKNQTQMQMMEEHHTSKQGSSFASQCNVPTEKSIAHRPHTPSTPARIKTNTLKWERHIFALSIQKQIIKNTV